MHLIFWPVLFLCAWAFWTPLPVRSQAKRPSPTSWTIDTTSHHSDIHVYPNHDYRPHVPERTCWCRPELDDLDGYGECVVHQALDRRDLYQQGDLRLH